MSFLRLLLALTAFALSAQSALARTCQYEKGEARWSIKTSVPAVNDASEGREVDLASLISLHNPTLSKKEVNGIQDTRWSGSVTAKDRSGHNVTLREGDVVAVSGYVYRVRCQKDGDYHVEIGAGPSRKSSCLIVEVPDPEQIHDPALKDLVSRARDALDKLDRRVFESHSTKKPLKIRVTGQFFLDETHSRSADPGGGRGSRLDSGRHCASNLWEIHPVTRLE